MHKGFLKIAAVFGILSVLLGAFAAHSLKGVISERAVDTFETAVRYQFYHTFALMLTGILYKEFNGSITRWAGIFFVTGIMLFSGSLYCLAGLEAMVSPNYKWIGILTPIGGLFFISGWIMLFMAFFKKY